MASDTPAKKKSRSKKQLDQDKQVLQKLVAALKGLKHGAVGYPPRFDELLELIDDVPADSVGALLKGRSLSKEASLFAGGSAKREVKEHAYICLKDDEASVLAKEDLYTEVLTLAQGKTQTEIFPPSKLEKKMPSTLQKPFREGLKALIDGGKATEVGCLSEGGNLKYFLLAKVRGGAIGGPKASQSEPAPAMESEDRARAAGRRVPDATGPMQEPQPVEDTSEPQPIDDLPTPLEATNHQAPTNHTPSVDLEAFAREFAATYASIDNGDNWVHLLELRQHMSQYSREQFDEGLSAVRRQRVFGLEAAEGRHRTPSPEELESAIKEHGRTLMFVTRRDE